MNAQEIVIAPDHPALPGHFPGLPVVPGVLLLDHVAQAARAALGCGALRAVPRAKFAAPLRPGERLRIQLTLREGARAGFTCHVGETLVAAGEMAFAP
jgi:3-hydroxymyristoyl/3-hydroxydecanoyl-(acyl carrier protein) dehydratase